MRPYLLVLVVVLAAAAGLSRAQEQQTPFGEWCQRAPTHSKKAHVCTCAQHDCADPEPLHVSAHVDPKCKNYCHVQACACEKMDCP